MIIGVVIGIAGVSILYYSPIFKPFPQPTGLYNIGTTTLEFTDTSRKEIFEQNRDEHRRIALRLFYPAHYTDALKQYPYLGQKMPYYQKFVSDFYHIPECITKLFLRGIQTYSFVDAQLSNEKEVYPVILFSHGLLGLPSDTALIILENLASHGYIVFAIDHTYLNALTLFADGTVASSLQLSDQFNKMSQKEQKQFQSDAIEVYKADMKFVIDELETLNNDPQSFLYNRMDLNAIAVMGHSAGGTASIEFCRSDNRCKAAIDLDGWYDQAIGEEPINKALLLIFGSKSLEIGEPTPEYLKRKELTNEQYFEREEAIQEHREKLCSVPNCSFIVINGASHNDFGDEMFIKWPLREWSAIDAYKATENINGHIIKFLSASLSSNRN